MPLLIMLVIQMNLLNHGAEEAPGKSLGIYLSSCQTVSTLIMFVIIKRTVWSREPSSFLDGRGTPGGPEAQTASVLITFVIRIRAV